MEALLTSDEAKYQKWLPDIHYGILKNQQIIIFGSPVNIWLIFIIEQSA